MRQAHEVRAYCSGKNGVWPPELLPARSLIDDVFPDTGIMDGMGADAPGQVKQKEFFPVSATIFHANGSRPAFEREAVIDTRRLMRMRAFEAKVFSFGRGRSIFHENQPTLQK